MGRSTVSTPNTKGTLSADPSVARNTLRSSIGHWSQFFSGRPGPGFSPPAIDRNIIRRVGRSSCVRCTPSAKRRRRLSMVVSKLSHCAFLRALAYDMRWSVRCRRWKPMIRRRNLWCAVRSSAKCYLPRVHVTHPYSRVCIILALHKGRKREENDKISLEAELPPSFSTCFVPIHDENIQQYRCIYNNQRGKTWCLC